MSGNMAERADDLHKQLIAEGYAGSEIASMAGRMVLISIIMDGRDPADVLRHLTREVLKDYIAALEGVAKKAREAKANEAGS